MVAKLTASAGTLTAGNITYYLERGTVSGTTWTYTTLGDTGNPVVNSAVSGDQIRVRLQYPHRLVTGRLFTRIANAQSGTAVTLYATMVMRRE
jgi:hypothetical protein